MCGFHVFFSRFFFSLLSGIRAYEQLGFRAFGTPGKMAAGIAITLQNIGGEIVKRYVSGDTMYCFVTCQGHSTRIHLCRESDQTWIDSNAICFSFTLQVITIIFYFFIVMVTCPPCFLRAVHRLCSISLQIIIVQSIC